jgi:hypothetical protein
MDYEQPTDLSTLDVLGTLYTTDETPTALPGWHVNSPWPVAGWEAYKVTPTTPRRVFAGAPTHCYTFESEAAFLEAAATADLSAPPAVPHAVTRRQARQALLLAGKLAQVQPAIDAIPNATQRALIAIEWEDSLHFERDRPALIGLATALGMTSADLDALFIAAAAL